MVRYKQTGDILKLMLDKEHSRNIGIIAHIDHGKTTMSDSLLAAAGLMSPDRAGEARALDYLEEEQARGITIKTANISLLYEDEKGQPYVINLIDTPGHVDFSGKVTRAMRALDGCILLVDAVEEFQIMTEVRLRLALDEAVRPVLYINKFDRLIKELKMDADMVQEKILRIIGQFNTIVQTFGSDEIKNDWIVNAGAGQVCFGSALDRWGFTLPMLQKKGITFKQLVQMYQEGKLEEAIATLESFPEDLRDQEPWQSAQIELQNYRTALTLKSELDGALAAFAAGDKPRLVAMVRTVETEGYEHTNSIIGRGAVPFKLYIDELVKLGIEENCRKAGVPCVAGIRDFVAHVLVAGSYSSTRGPPKT